MSSLQTAPADEVERPKPGILTRLGRDTGYVLANFPVSIARFVVVLVLFLLGIATTVVWIGLPILVAAALAARSFSDLARVQLGWVRGRRVRRPAYQRARDKKGFGALLMPIRQRQGWKDIAFAIVSFPVAIVAFVFAVTWWAVTLGGLLAFTWWWSIYQIPGYDGMSTLLLGEQNYTFEVAFQTAAGVVFALTLPFVLRGCSMMISGTARGLLTRERLADLQEQVTELSDRRDAVVSAETSALRRLERDIHDGPQQRLMRIAMDLSTAKRRVAEDPSAAESMLDEAVDQTRDTLYELRSLSRGIAPPILVDRGLRAALAAVAGRSPFEVRLEVDVPDSPRLPQEVENTAYFVVTEALANAAKHSGADQCSVSVSGDETMVHVIVTDNGRGGAHPSKGHGLAGLTDRVHGLGGRLEVESPTGGPTILTAELPCAS